MMFGLMLMVVALALLWLTRPLWRLAIAPTQRRRAANVAAYRQRLAEIEADHAAGLLDADTYGTLKQELDARVIQDTESGESVVPAVSSGGGRVLGLVIGVVVVAVGAGGYALEGNWRQPVAQPAEQATGQPLGTVEEMVGRLEKRLQETPADVEGWAMLGRSYFMMERYAESAEAYEKANQLTESSEPDLLVNEGEALALARDRDLLGRPQALFESALKLAPEHGKALWYAGLAAEQAQDAERAKRYWTALSRQELPEPLRAALGERLHAVGGVPAAPRAGAAEGQTAAVAESGLSLRVAVRLKPGLQSAVPPGATLFVFAKAASGPPMPLAVYRGSASELPREVVLDDSMAMTPALKLSQFDRWIVTARLSRTGQPQAQSGDVQGSLTVERSQLGATALGLELNEVVP
jgi:cytochrome c-type biogenesis protein CcmH